MTVNTITIKQASSTLMTHTHTHVHCVQKKTPTHVFFYISVEYVQGRSYI